MVEQSTPNPKFDSSNPTENIVNQPYRVVMYNKGGGLVLLRSTLRKTVIFNFRQLNILLFADCFVATSLYTWLLIFTTLNFLHNILMDPISLSACPYQAFPA
jgi:hypothetical protein